MDINRIIEYFLLKKKVHERKKALLMMDPSANCRIENDPSKIEETSFKYAEYQYYYHLNKWLTEQLLRLYQCNIPADYFESQRRMEHIFKQAMDMIGSLDNEKELKKIMLHLYSSNEIEKIKDQ